MKQYIPPTQHAFYSLDKDHMVARRTKSELSLLINAV